MWMLNPKTDPLAYFHVISHPFHPGTPHFLTPAKVSFHFNRSEQYRLVSKHTKNDFSTVYHVYLLYECCGYCVVRFGGCRNDDSTRKFYQVTLEGEVKAQHLSGDPLS